MLRAGIQLPRTEWDRELLYSREQRVLKRKGSSTMQRLGREGNTPWLMLPWYFITVGAVKKLFQSRIGLFSHESCCLSR